MSSQTYTFCLPVWLLTIWLPVITLISVLCAKSKQCESAKADSWWSINLIVEEARLSSFHAKENRRSISTAHFRSRGKCYFPILTWQRTLERRKARLTFWIKCWVFGDKKGLTLFRTTSRGYPFNWNTVLRCLRSFCFALPELQLQEINSHV